MIAVMLLGFIQGLTEFLPVSSSGHLVLLGNFMGTQDGGSAFEVMLHFGTLLSTTVIFRQPIIQLLTGILKRDPMQIKLMLCIIATTIPTAILGKLFEDPLEQLFSSPFVVSIMLFVTGGLLFIPKLLPPSEKTPQELGYGKVFLLGVLQALAIIPGISRSGTTIATGLALGLSRKSAGEYSFLISLPVILGVTLLKLPELAEGGRHFSLWQMTMGTFIAFLSGLVALKFLLIFVHKGKLHYFSIYCFLAGALGLFIFR